MQEESAIGPAGGFLLFLLGVWVLVRTVAGNPSLVDILLNLRQSSATPPAPPQSKVVRALGAASPITPPGRFAQGAFGVGLSEYGVSKKAQSSGTTGTIISGVKNAIGLIVSGDL